MLSYANIVLDLGMNNIDNAKTFVTANHWKIRL